MKDNFNDRILVISDQHHPYEHPDLIAFLTAVKKEYKPTRVINIGDEDDQHDSSYHESDPELDSAGPEHLKAKKALKRLEKLFPYMDFVYSNHGSLHVRKAKTGKIPLAFIKDKSEVFDTPGWQWHDKIIVKPKVGRPILFVHGLSNNALNNALRTGYNVVQGHFHTKQEIVYAWRYDGEVCWGMTVGCLINPKSPAFAYAAGGTLRPALGVSIIINGIPHIIPMMLKPNGRWVGFI